MGYDLENHGNGFDLPEPEVDVEALKKRMLDRITKVHSDEAEIERLRAELAEARKQERERCANACKPPKICGHQGFAGPSCCVLPPGHSVPHEYSEPTIWTARDCEAAIRALEDE